MSFLCHLKNQNWSNNLKLLFEVAFIKCFHFTWPNLSSHLLFTSHLINLLLLTYEKYCPPHFKTTPCLYNAVILVIFVINTLLKATFSPQIPWREQLVHYLYHEVFTLYWLPSGNLVIKRDKLRNIRNSIIAVASIFKAQENKQINIIGWLHLELEWSRVAVPFNSTYSPKPTLISKCSIISIVSEWRHAHCCVSSYQINSRSSASTTRVGVKVQMNAIY